MVYLWAREEADTGADWLRVPKTQRTERNVSSDSRHLLAYLANKLSNLLAIITGGCLKIYFLFHVMLNAYVYISSKLSCLVPWHGFLAQLLKLHMLHSHF